MYLNAFFSLFRLLNEFLSEIKCNVLLWRLATQIQPTHFWNRTIFAPWENSSSIFFRRYSFFLIRSVVGLQTAVHPYFYITNFCLDFYISHIYYSWIAIHMLLVVLFLSSLGLVFNSFLAHLMLQLVCFLLGKKSTWNHRLWLWWIREQERTWR